MMEFANYYETLSTAAFFTAAANFWRYRALLYGNEKAVQWKADWFQEHPETLIPVALSPYSNSANGDKLRALGFEFFDPEREYSIGIKDNYGVIEVSFWCDTVGPDEDGFGMEELYDTWFMDEFLNPVPGVPMIKAYSSHDRWVFPEKFDQYRELAAEVLRKNKEHDK